MKPVLKPRWVSRSVFRLGERIEGRNIASKLQTLKSWSREAASHRQERNRKKLIDQVEYAGLTVPYYRELFRRSAFSIEKLKKDFTYFQDLPFLTKEVILSNPKQFIAEPFVGKQLHERKTAGSTGPSLSIFYDQEALDWTSAINLFAHSMTGRDISDPEVLLSSDLKLFQPPFQARLKERVRCLVMNRTNVMTRKFDADGLQKLYLELKQARAYLVQGHPSSLYALALYLRDQKIDPQKLFDVFESTGESLDEEKVALIEQYVGCKVFNRYGNAEFGVVAHGVDRYDLLRSLEDSVYVENFIYGAGIPELVCTGLLNRAMPLIRYRTGDIAEVVYHDSVSFLRNVTGRIHDIIEIEGKKFPTHFVKDVLDRVGGVDEFQFVRLRTGEIQLNLVLNTPSKRNEIIAPLQALFKQAVKYNFVRMSELKRVGWNDKFKYLITE